MTTVGYGDGVSMPNLDVYKIDYWDFTLHIIASVFAFYLCQAALMSFLDNIGTVSPSTEYVQD